LKERRFTKTKDLLMNASESKNTMLTFEAAVTTLLNAVNCKLSAEITPLDCCLGRILTEDIHSPLQIPSYHNSAMDGYAVKFADLHCHRLFRVVGHSLAGHPYRQPVPAGCCVRIMTGAELPAGLDTVVMQEDVQLQSDGSIEFKSKVSAGAHVRLAGSEIEKGTLVLSAGQRLGPLHLGLAATLGFARLPVFRKLKVGVLSTGDELVKPGEGLSNGQLYDSNRFVLAAMLKRLDLELVDYGWVADDPVQLKTLFQKVAAEADALITSGGVSVGDSDYTKQVLAELGQVDFWKVAIKPGKPFAFGKLNDCWFFGLPGNPVSAIVTLDQLAQPALRKLAGEKVMQRPLFEAVASHTFRKKPGRLDFQRAVVEQGDGRLTVRPVGKDSSGMLTSLIDANCFAVLEAERSDVAAGDLVAVQFFSELLN
jgi:molybdopterin molybdotransferase